MRVGRVGLQKGVGRGFAGPLGPRGGRLLLQSCVASKYQRNWPGPLSMPCPGIWSGIAE